MAQHRKPLGPLARISQAAVASLALAGLLGGATVTAASAAPGNGAKKGHLVLTVDGALQVLPPGKAVKAALAACEGDPTLVAVTSTDVVRAAFPLAFTVCDGVTLTSQVAPDTTEVVA